MKFLHWKKNKLKLGSITIFKVKESKGKFNYYFLGLPVWRRTTSVSNIIYDFKKNKDFDTHKFDRKLEYIAPIEKDMETDLYPNRIAILGTELYATGGHSRCINDMVDILHDDYAQAVFFTNLSSSWENASGIMSDIQKYSLVLGKDINHITWKKDIQDLFYMICKFSPKVLFVWIHPDDVYATILLAMIKRHTNIKIFYCPHASHFPNLGISFADIILESIPVTAYITQNLRKCLKTYFCPMINKRLIDFPKFSSEEILTCRRSLGIQDTELCTMSGASSYKFFDTANASEYFQTIKRLLERNPKVRHIVLSNFSNKKMAVIEKIFGTSPCRNRLVFHPLTPHYELIFCCADVFLDSFPVSSALTMIDLMRLKVPAVIKINRENAHWSFHEYQRPNFPFMFDNNEDFLKGTEKLLGSKELREQEKEENYHFYMNRYEGSLCKRRLCELINNADSLDSFCTVLDPTPTYQFRELMTV